MRKILVVTPVLALLSGCFFGPPGNALGLEGEYVGTIQSDISGATTYYQGGQTTNVTVQGISDSPGNITIERGYGDVDAFLTGLGCPALLVRSGAQLILLDDAECTTENDIKAEGNGTSVRTETIVSNLISDLTVTSNGSGVISLEASGERETEDRQNDERTETSSLDIEFEFNGTRVGAE